MPYKEAPDTRQTLKRLRRVVRRFLRSPDGRKARFLVIALLVLMLGINGMNVLNSYVGRDFFSAIEARDHAEFVRQAWLYVAVFAGSTVIAVFFRNAEERLALLWRGWQTQEVVQNYLSKRVYLHMKEAGAITNPDQRVTEDIRALTTTTLSFLLMILSGTFTTISFSGVLWSISPLLFCVAILYAAVGSALAFYLGRPLIRLNYQQADREADFRSELIYVHQEAKGLAFARDERRMRERLSDRIEQLVGNFRKIIAVNRNLNFFTNGYNYMIQLIPPLLVAPMFIAGGVEFGVIGQSTMAFATLVGAFSLVVTQFQSISSYASVITRLSELVEASEQAVAREERSCLDCKMTGEQIEYTGLNLRVSDKDERVVLKDLNVILPPHRDVLITGPNQLAKEALFSATAGLHDSGGGHILRPPSGSISFLLERPYLPPGTMYELLTPPKSTERPPDSEILAVFKELGLDLHAVSEGKFDQSIRWADELSFGEGQLLAVARAILAKPRYIFLDHLDSALDAEEFKVVRTAIARRGITAIVIGNGKSVAEEFDAVLELLADGGWKWREKDTTMPELSP